MKVALLGTGLMGYPMAQRLVDAGHTVFAYNRTRSKADPLSKFGVQVVNTPVEAIDQCECVILVLTDASAINHVLDLNNNPSYKGKTIIQMGTIAPLESIAIGERITQCGGDYLECPVLGSRGEAINGQLILMVGATSTLFQKWQTLLEVFGAHPRLIGDVGKAAALKLALNHIIASHAVGFSLSLGVIEKNKVDENIFMDILKGSALYAKMFEKKYANWHERNYDNPNFPAKHLLKDVELIMQEAKEKNLSVDVLTSIRNVISRTVDKGLGDKDYSAVFNVINNI